MADIPFPRGVRDLMPNEALFRNELLKRIEELFQRFGFLVIDTPVFESLKVLRAKNAIGEDIKLLYEMKFEDLALRYDHTVSLARYMAMHNEVPLPFKRYAIGKSWRREEPQKLRYREFTQADVDIIGGRKGPTNAECMAVAALALESVGLDYKVLINNRLFIDALLGSIGIKEEMFLPIMRIIDKLDKVGRDGVLDQLQKLGLDREIVGKVDSLINMPGTNDEKLAYLEKTIKNKEAIDETRETLELLALYGLRGQWVIDFSLMRGFDYYTGIVFEYKLASDKTRSSVGGGGRYDNLIGLYGKKSLPAVGVSLGIDRILDVLDFSASIKHTYASVFVANIKDNNYPYALKMANQLRANGISVELNTASRNISNQLAYANALKFKFALIVGDGEEKSNKVRLRDLVNGSESIVSLQEALVTLKKSVS